MMDVRICQLYFITLCEYSFFFKSSISNHTQQNLHELCFNQHVLYFFFAQKIIPNIFLGEGVQLLVNFPKEQFKRMDIFG